MASLLKFRRRDAMTRTWGPKHYRKLSVTGFIFSIPPALNWIFMGLWGLYGLTWCQFHLDSFNQLSVGSQILILMGYPFVTFTLGTISSVRGPKQSKVLGTAVMFLGAFLFLLVAFTALRPS
jgi:hypothetical protein